MKRTLALFAVLIAGVSCSHFQSVCPACRSHIREANVEAEALKIVSSAKSLEEMEVRLLSKKYCVSEVWCKVPESDLPSLWCGHPKLEYVPGSEPGRIRLLQCSSPEVTISLFVTSRVEFLLALVNGKPMLIGAHERQMSF